MKYNIYAGLKGAFGPPTYCGTLDFSDEVDAENFAYKLALDDYQHYEGNCGIKSWNQIAEEEGLDPLSDQEQIDILYENELEEWLNYYVIPTDEDNITNIFEL